MTPRTVGIKIIVDIFHNRNRETVVGYPLESAIALRL